MESEALVSVSFLLDESCIRMSSFVAAFLSVLCVLDPNLRLALFRSHSSQFVSTETQRTRFAFKDNFKGRTVYIYTPLYTF